MCKATDSAFRSLHSALRHEPRPSAQASAILQVLIGTRAQLESQISELDAKFVPCAMENNVVRRFITVPGIGTLVATAIATLTPPTDTFRKIRDFAAYPGSIPRQHSKGGKQRQGTTTKIGLQSLRGLLIICANNVIIDRLTLRETPLGTCQGGLLTSKPPVLVHVAFANKMARTVWILMARGGVNRSPCPPAIFWFPDMNPES